MHPDINVMMQISQWCNTQIVIMQNSISLDLRLKCESDMFFTRAVMDFWPQFPGSVHSCSLLFDDYTEDVCRLLSFLMHNDTVTLPFIGVSFSSLL